MNIKHGRNGCLLFTLLIVINQCASDLVQGGAPWMVKIEKCNLFNSECKYHCAGVLTKSNVVLTSVKCLDTFPENYHMTLYAGSINPMYYHMQKKCSSFGAQLVESNKIVSILITPPIQQTEYVDFIATCKQQNCTFSTFGFQYGYYPYSHNYVIYDISLQVTQYDFSNSTALCMELNEDNDKKYCAYHSCDAGLVNVGGEVLTKIHKGQSFLMGFWDYDACDKKVRVFDKLSSIVKLR